MKKLTKLVEDCQSCEGKLIYSGENFNGADPNTGYPLDIYECRICKEIYYIQKEKIRGSEG